MLLDNSTHRKSIRDIFNEISHQSSQSQTTHAGRKPKLRMSAKRRFGGLEGGMTISCPPRISPLCRASLYELSPAIIVEGDIFSTSGVDEGGLQKRKVKGYSKLRKGPDLARMPVEQPPLRLPFRQCVPPTDSLSPPSGTIAPSPATQVQPPVAATSLAV